MIKIILFNSCNFGSGNQMLKFCVSLKMIENVYGKYIQSKKSTIIFFEILYFSDSLFKPSYKLKYNYSIICIERNIFSTHPNSFVESNPQRILYEQNYITYDLKKHLKKITYINKIHILN